MPESALQCGRAVLVTGGTGFIGRAVIEQLLAMGFESEIRSLSLPGEEAPAEWEERVRCLSGDVTSESDVSAAMQGVGCVIHLASLLGAGSYDRHHAITVCGTENILKAARSENARVVIVSSIAIYGEYVRDRLCREDVGHGPYYDPYSCAKQAQEAITLHYINEYRVDAVIARPANVFGAGSMPWVDVMAVLLNHAAPIIIDEGEGDSGLVHVRDVATALVALAQCGVSGESYNIAASMNISWKQYIGDLAEMLGVVVPDSVSFETLRVAARQFEDPAKKLVPTEYTTLPLATLFLLGSDNRFPSSKLTSHTGWVSMVDYPSACAEIRRYVALESERGSKHK